MFNGHRSFRLTLYGIWAVCDHSDLDQLITARKSNGRAMSSHLHAWRLLRLLRSHAQPSTVCLYLKKSTQDALILSSIAIRAEKWKSLSFGTFARNLLAAAVSVDQQLCSEEICARKIAFETERLGFANRLIHSVADPTERVVHVPCSASHLPKLFAGAGLRLGTAQLTAACNGATSGEPSPLELSG